MRYEVTKEEASAVTDAGSGSWTGPEAELASVDRLLSLEKQLELVDRVKSLEAELAQVTEGRTLSPTAQLDAEQQLIAMRASPPWRVGRVITIPLRIVQRIIRRSSSR